MARRYCRIAWGAATTGLVERLQVSRRESVDTLRGYIRKVEIFQDHAAEGLLEPQPAVPEVVTFCPWRSPPRKRRDNFSL